MGAVLRHTISGMGCLMTLESVEILQALHPMMASAARQIGEDTQERALNLFQFCPQKELAVILPSRFPGVNNNLFTVYS